MTDEPGAALVLTLESTQISACSYGSLVSKGKFTGEKWLVFATSDISVNWNRKESEIINFHLTETEIEL